MEHNCALGVETEWDKGCPAFRTASDKSWAWRPGNEAIFGPLSTWITVNWNSQVRPSITVGSNLPVVQSFHDMQTTLLPSGRHLAQSLLF